MGRIKDGAKKSRFYPLAKRFQKRLSLLKTSVSMIWIRLICSVPSKHVRRFFLNSFNGVKIHKTVPIYNRLEWWKGPLIIGKGSSIGFRNHLDCRCGIEIGSNVCLASDVTIWTLHHDYNSPTFATCGGKVTIGDYAWLCSNCVILPGVTIGEGAVVAAGAVVCKDVAPWTVVGGVPARVIAERKQQDYNYQPSDCWLPFL